MPKQDRAWAIGLVAALIVLSGCYFGLGNRPRAPEPSFDLSPLVLPLDEEPVVATVVATVRVTMVATVLPPAGVPVGAPVSPLTGGELATLAAKRNPTAEPTMTATVAHVGVGAAAPLSPLATPFVLPTPTPKPTAEIYRVAIPLISDGE